MALTDDNNMVMPVAPMYGGNGVGFGGFDNDWGWIILLLLFAGGGYGFGGGFGGGFGFNNDFAWLMNGQQGINANTNAGFRDAMLNDGITSIRDGIAGLSTQLCGCCGDMQMALANGFAGVEQGANTRQMANMQTAFGIQSQIAQGSSDNRVGLADLKYTVATENCADRQALNEGVATIIANQTAGIQRILDQMCNDKIDSKNDTINQLRQELLYARGQASQDVQTARILAGQTAEVDALYNRLDSCPIGTTPVYGRTPIFSCNSGCGCGCGNI